jgi:uroporphyrinogen decarboxylase
MGAIVEISDQYDVTYLRQAKDFVTRHWHSFPVKTRKDWEEKIKWRYNPQDPLRFPPDFTERCKALNQRDYPLRLALSGPFWQLREWCGFEQLCMWMVEEPEFVQEMVDFWADFVSATLEQVVEHLEIDSLMVNEDMAYKMHSMISPAMTRRFLVPVWQRWGDILRSKCAVYSVDSDGYIGELIPCFIEGGFQYTWPVEVAAGNDIVAYRHKYGKRIALGGGIDKRALAVGGDTMRTELLRVIPPLLVDGGFLPGCDHGVPPDISWPNFVEYSRFLAELTGWL